MQTLLGGVRKEFELIQLPTWLEMETTVVVVLIELVVELY